MEKEFSMWSHPACWSSALDFAIKALVKNKELFDFNFEFTLLLISYEGTSP
jgi:hypothetical protein